eukprot:6990194-Alexandrium_andersonii.AAC.1
MCSKSLAQQPAQPPSVPSCRFDPYRHVCHSACGPPPELRCDDRERVVGQKNRGPQELSLIHI